MDSALDNASIARLLGEIGDLLEIRGENPFKIRAYRNAADAVASSAERIAGFDLPRLLAIPGIGKDLAAKIMEIAATGSSRYREELLGNFPPTILDLLRLQGVGPKTVALLYQALGIGTLDALEEAARAGRLRELRGMGAKKEALILKALDERRRYAGRHLLADASDEAARLAGFLQERAPATEFVPVGSVRRGTETCGDIDVLAIGGSADIMNHVAAYDLVDRVLGKGETKTGVLLRDGIQADIRLVAPESRGAALLYFTGSKAHNIVLRDRALTAGLRLNEYGLFRIDGNERIAGESEASVYAALGLDEVPPELRENRGEIEAALARRLPRLVTLADIQGDLHAHTDATDGRDSIEEMATGARAAGLSYLAITDHSRSLAMTGGLDEQSTLTHARRIRAASRRLDGVSLLAGIECDILPDGRLDLAEDCLAELDLVIASVHSAFNQDESQMTERILRAMESPVVDIIGHPTGRLLLRREAYQVDIEQVIAAAARLGVMLEISSQVDRLDLSDVHARLARDRGVMLVINTDSHSDRGFGLLRWGVTVARRAWLEPRDVANTRPLEQFRALLRRNRPH
jgi:DNA polymerase (family 10)